ncbi:putative amidase [Paraburkholderia ribeironis]|uniref:Putative amidase n=1 Tax=Paraburkholderia ribeironis TaxID=1247936 RepID=A0A1N7RZL5_9BURK|nr:amidase family protein [Paraburkholderia ribeironis]SIT40568.1 putative amidase [Paraburkholderia ribeironis]
MLHQKSFAQLRELYRNHDLSPVDVVKSALHHAEEVNARMNAFVLIDHDRALRHARLSERRWQDGTPAGPLDGMPVSVKEFAMVAGWPCPRGSAVTSREPDRTSTVFVQRLEDAGAVLLGKTRAPEFNWKGVTDSPAFGITRNPWNPGLTTGGSSGGCAAAVSSGVVRVSVGSDAGGSVRIPASFTGVIGLKPTHGRIPLSPSPSAFFNIAHAGPLASDMRDMTDVYRAISGPAPADWTSFCSMPEGADIDAHALRLSILRPARWQPQSEAAVTNAVQQVLAALQADGFDLMEIDFDIESASRVGRDLYRLGCAATVRNIDPALHAQLDPGLLDFVRGASDWDIAQFQQLCQLRDQHANRLAEIFRNVDVLILPTLPLCAFETGRNVPRGYHSDDWMAWNPFTPAFNSTQVPALSYPVWPQNGALPVGVQLVAGRSREAHLLALGHWLQAKFPIRIAPAA